MTRTTDTMVTVEENIKCDTCDNLLAVGEQAMKLAWTERVICQACVQKREEQAKQERVNELMQGAVLLQLMNAIERVGEVIAAHGGMGEKRARAIVKKNGIYYRVAVSVIDESDINTSYY